MKKFERQLTLISAITILIVAVLGCGEGVKVPDWPKSKLIAGKADKLSHISNVLADDKFAYVIIGGTVADQNGGTNGLRKVEIATGVVSVLDDGTRMPQPEQGGLAMDEKYLYWNGGGNILRILKEGGMAEVVVSEKVGIGIDMTVDNEKVYWANHGYYSPNSPTKPSPVFSVVKTGGKPEIFADEQKIPGGVATDDKYVYWSASDGIFKKLKTGGEIETVFQVSDKENVDKLTIGGDELYFGFRGDGNSRWALRKISKNGGEPVTLVKTFSLKNMVIDDRDVYFFDEDTMRFETLCKVSKNGGEVTRFDRGYSSGTIAQTKTHIFFAGLDDLYSFQK